MILVIYLVVNVEELISCPINLNMNLLFAIILTYVNETENSVWFQLTLLSNA